MTGIRLIVTDHSNQTDIATTVPAGYMATLKTVLELLARLSADPGVIDADGTVTG